MQNNALFTKALAGDNLTCSEGVKLFSYTPVREILALADKIRYKFNPCKKVSWQIDRNVNYTNICISGCLFCNFHCTISQKERGYAITTDELRNKIEELRNLGGDQLLLQGGLHPLYDITYYENLLKEIKSIDPLIKLNAFGPPEVAHIARLSKLTIKETLSRLVAAGLDTLPGAGAEILSDRVRKILSPGKPDSKQWADVMREAHRMGIGTTATMVYGHIETIEERMEHLILLRDIQTEKPDGAPGFRAFICWPMQSTGTKLGGNFKIEPLNPVEHLKMVALSRIILNNIPHIQASWLTIGRETAQLALHAGADDMGSIMIEENVVSSAGAKNSMDSLKMQQTIREAGFEPWLRNQDYSPRHL